MAFFLQDEGIDQAHQIELVIETTTDIKFPNL